MSLENEVTVLFEGYSKCISDQIMHANCTCVLIQSRNACIVVDTLTSWDGDQLTAALSKLGLSNEDVTHVVCTHGHSDHIGCNYLFTNAKEHIVGQSISTRHEYRSHDFKAENYSIDDGVQVTTTPGHTLDSVSVIVENSNFGTVAIVGDLFEKASDCNDESVWIDAGTENEQEQRKNRLRMAELADWIIPGHGAPFAVTETIKTQLKLQLNK